MKYAGDGCLDQRRFGEASQAYEQAVRWFPQNLSAYGQLGKLYAQLGDSSRKSDYYIKALAAFGEGVKLSSEHDPWMSANYAHMLAKLGRTAKADSLIADIIRRVPCGEYAYYIRGLMQLERGARDAAIESFSLSERFGYWQARIELARLRRATESK
jgi:tetratricopeptide (TPR) repeat protein